MHDVVLSTPARAGTNARLFPQVDSAISFSCITTPEVVSSCNTTSSTAQSAVAVDPKVTYTAIILYFIVYTRYQIRHLQTFSITSVILVSVPYVDLNN